MAKRPSSRQPSQADLDEAPMVAVLGSDESAVKQMAAELAAKMTPPGADEFSVEIIDAAADNSEQAASKVASAIQALQTLSFFGGTKLVWLKNANFCGDNVLGRSNAVQDALESLGQLLEEGLPDGTRLLFSASPIDRRRAFYKVLGKQATVLEFDAIDTSKPGWEDAVGHLAADKAAEAGLRFERDALELFVSRTGGDTRQIVNEIEKLLLTDPAGGKISPDLVREMVPQSRAGIIFELSNAIAAKDLKRALEMVDQLLFQGETAVAILLVAVIPTIRNLLVVCDLMKRHQIRTPSYPQEFVGALNRLPEQATRHLPRKKDGTVNTWTLGIAAVHAAKFQPAALQDALAGCLEANTSLVTSQLDPKIVLGRLLVRALAASPGRTKP